VKIAVGMLTWNHIKYNRAQMFKDAWDSLEHGALQVDRILVTNGSTDGTQDVVKALGGIVDDGNTQIWYGMELAIKWCIDKGADIVLFTADDIVMRPFWAERLERFWQDAPDEVKLCSLILEPVYPWNTIRGTLEAGGERALLRDSVGGCSWSFRAKDWPLIGPLPQKMPGEDLDVCMKLIAQGYYLAQIEMGDHVGERHSAWSNESWKYAVEVDRNRWKI
jgi:glycosyltransferase involved in cell wall biosynthesis